MLSNLANPQLDVVVGGKGVPMCARVCVCVCV